MKKKVLVTGATGFLGRRLIKQLSMLPSVEIIACGRKDVDLTETNQIENFINRIGSVDTLIHLAALVPKSKKEDMPIPMIETNTIGTLNLLSALKKRVRKIIFASTAEVYGMPNVKKPIDEEYLPQPNSFYGGSKYAAEHLVKLFSKQYDIPYITLRFSTIYGPGDPIERAIPNFIKQALAGKKPRVYGGSQLRDYLYIDDAVNAMILALKSSKSGVFNIASGKTVSIKDAAIAIAEKINPSLGIELLPDRKNSFDLVLDISKAKKELGFVPKYHFPDKLPELIEWGRKN